MQTYDEFLRERVRTEITRLTDELLQGLAPDYAQYKYTIGQIHALEKVVSEFSEDARSDMNAS